MAADASIAMSVKDNLSAAILSMRNSMTAYRKDAEELGNELDRLSAQKTTVKVDLDKAVADVKAARAAYAALGKEGADAARLAAAEDDWRKAEMNLESIRSAYNTVSRQVKETTRSFEDASGAISKIENRAGSGGGSGGGLLSALGGAGLTDMTGNALGEAANTLIGSMYGSETGGLISGALSGAMSGAAMGSLAGPVGTAIGAAVGGASGLLTSGMAVYQKQDEAFKAYYQDLYQTSSAATAESISSGSAIAAGRETDLISFSTLFGDRDTAENYLSGLVDMSNRTPFLYDDLTAMSKTLATYGYGADSILPVLQTVGDAGAALGMATSDMSAVATALGRMKSSDKASLEYLNMLNDRGIGAVGYLAEAKGISVGKTYEKISKGEISGTEAVEIILNALSRSKDEGGFAGAMEEQSRAFAGLTSTLEGLRQEVDNAAGEGYNEVRKQGLHEEIAAYSGALGEAMSSLNAISGETQALLDNLKDQYRREALSAVLLGDRDGELFTDEAWAKLDQLRADYVEAEAAYEESVRETGRGNLEAGMKMEALKEEAITLAAAAYDSSQEVQTLQDVQLEQIAATRELTAAFDGWANSYAIQREADKGRSDTVKTDGIKGDGDYRDSTASNYSPIMTAFAGEETYAYGLERVPYDGYPALLHEGERVLTAREARWQDREREELSRGLSAAMREDDSCAAAIINNDPDETRWFGHAYGLKRAPYDDYPALLHEGERVLTAREARAQDRERVWDRMPELLSVRETRERTPAPGSGDTGPAPVSVSITVTGNTFGAGMDEAAVAQALADQIVLQLSAGGGR